MSIAQLFNVEMPIIQAPMAGSQGSALAAAVCNAGGLGSLPAAMFTSDGLREELVKLLALTDKPFNVNFFCHTPPQPDAARELALFLRQLVHQDRDEDDVVDAQHDLERGERRERDPGIGVGDPVEHRGWPRAGAPGAVSYTHLTRPPGDLGKISGGAE